MAARKGREDLRGSRGHVQTLLSWTCLREKQMNLGTESSYQEVRFQPKSLLFSAEAASAAYRARMQEIKLFC